MERYPFIFSDQKNYRIKRHLAFWTSWWLFSSILYSFSGPAMRISYAERFPISMLESLFYLIPHMFMAYTLMYLVIPKLIVKGKYLQSFFAVIACFILAAGLSAFVGMVLVAPIRNTFLGGRLQLPPHITEINFFLSLLAGLRGGITVGGLAAAIKLMKYWYLKEQRNLQLQKENVAAQLQLLKAQVHPHFLFNTMNNIYSYTQDTSPVASRLVTGLSDLLRYMLYEGAQPQVALEKELKMIRDYITLEQVRYGNKLELTIDFPERTDGLTIAPLILLPFVENCFKHGTSDVLEHPWISLNVSLDGNIMKMTLVNGKPENYESPKASSGIGIQNVQKRLQLLYENRHQLRIDNEEDVHIVNLKMELEQAPAPVKTFTLQPIVHA
jgi:sensor histidine kinase YesM